jgi:hypothetical protein
VRNAGESLHKAQETTAICTKITSDFGVLGLSESPAVATFWMQYERRRKIGDFVYQGTACRTA